MRSCRWIRRCDCAGNCRIEHDRGYCGTRELFALPRLVFVWPCGADTRWRCVGAAVVLGGAYDVCTAAAGFAGVTAAWQLPNYILLTRECVLFNGFSQPFGHDRGRTLLNTHTKHRVHHSYDLYAFKFKVQSTHTTHDTTLLCATAFASMCGVHDPAPLRCSFASQTLQAHQLPPNQMRHRFGAG